MHSIEIILRTASVLGCAVVAALLLATRRHDHTHWLGALYCVGVIAFVLTSMPDAEFLLGIWLYPLVLLCVIKAAWFWLFTKGLFAEDFRLDSRYLLIVASVGIYGTWQQMVFVPDSRIGTVTDITRALSLGFEALVLVLVMLALREACRGLAADLVERRRRLRGCLYLRSEDT